MQYIDNLIKIYNSICKKSLCLLLNFMLYTHSDSNCRLESE